MRTLILAVLCCAVPVTAHAADACFKVHGRLAVYNGGPPNTRIWVIGTKRILGVPNGPDGHEDATLPENVRGVFEADVNALVYGDFRVCPLEMSSAGNMQLVRLESARITATK